MIPLTEKKHIDELRSKQLIKQIVIGSAAEKNFF